MWIDAAACAIAVLHGDDLHVIPMLGEGAQDATVMSQFAVPIAGTLPDAQRRKVRRVSGRHLPLVHRVVGDPGQSHLAVAPWLFARPLDAVMEVLDLPRREVVEESG